jgi:hypothetical protein
MSQALNDVGRLDRGPGGSRRRRRIATGSVGWRGRGRPRAFRTAVLAAALLVGVALGGSEGAYPVLASDDGSSIAWLYREAGLVLAVGEADLSHANPVLARRAATVEAQRHVIRATALLRGTDGSRLVGTIRHGRVVLVETEARIVRVFYLARLADIDVR